MDTYLDTYLNNLICLLTGKIALDISLANNRTRTISYSIWTASTGRIIIYKHSRSLKHLIKLLFIISLLELFNFVYSI